MGVRATPSPAENLSRMNIKPNVMEVADKVVSLCGKIFLRDGKKENINICQMPALCQW